jgi:peptidyl-prolyl cis-trans isomerase C
MPSTKIHSTGLNFFRTFLIAAALLSTAGCGLSPRTPSAEASPSAAQQTPTVEMSPTPAATATPDEPLAAKVNGEAVFLSDYQAQLKQYQDAAASTPAATPSAPTGGSSTQTPASPSQIVLNDMVGEVLLAQAATKAGQTVTDDQLTAHISELTAKLGDAAKLSDWQTRMGYTDTSFRRALRTSMLAAWQRDQLAAAVPTTADQVHARQILLSSQDTANSVLQKLQAGEDFATLANTYDPSIGGDLGWFPKGYLTQSAVEDAAFALQPGQYSAIIETPLGFHIVQVIERDAQHPLSADALRFMQRQAIDQWVADQLKQSTVEILVNGS